MTELGIAIIVLQLLIIILLLRRDLTDKQKIFVGHYEDVTSHKKNWNNMVIRYHTSNPITNCSKCNSTKLKEYTQRSIKHCSNCGQRYEAL